MVLGDDEITVMNILSEHCYLVSDNATHASEVANSGEVVAWMDRNPHYFRKGLVKTKRRFRAARGQSTKQVVGEQLVRRNPAGGPFLR